MKGLFTALAAMLMAVGCQAQQPPTQVIYRFDDHRYLELKGWGCEGELWYTDTLRGDSYRAGKSVLSNFYQKIYPPF